MPQSAKRRTPHKQQKHSQFEHHRPDFVLLMLVAGLTVFGILMIYNVSAYEGFHEFNDKLYFVKQQLTWVLIGSIACLIGYKIDFSLLKKISPIFLAITILLLIVVLLPGIGTKVLGAKRWIVLSNISPILPSLTIQPAELAKPALVLYFAAWLTGKRAVSQMKKFLTFITIYGGTAGLVMLEPDLGTTLVITAAAGSVYFASGAPVLQLVALIPAGLLVLAGLIASAPYRLRRLTTFLDPQSDPQGAGYHITQILITLGSGGLSGVGLGNSGQKYGYLPEASTDSIFAVIGGELGFVGACILISFYVWFAFRAIKVAQAAPDTYTHLLAIGISLWICMQAIVNMGSMVALFPLTGVPLPFISYGGSSLVTTLFAIGLLLNVSKYTKR